MENKPLLLSVLVPVYNESACLLKFFVRLKDVLDRLSCRSEIIFVNDGSTDQTLEGIKDMQRLDNRVVYVDLSRNFGKEIAMTAGIDYVKGDALVILDADLQDPPELIPEMLLYIQQGYDDVYARRRSREGETAMKKLSSKAYYKLLKWLSDVPIQPDTGDFRMFSSRAVAALKSLKENSRNMKGLFSFVGFSKKELLFDREQRVAGTTKWNYAKLFRLAVNGFTAFSVKPLRWVSIAGVFVSFTAFFYMAYVFVKALMYGDPVAGYPSMLVIMLFLGGIQLLSLGIIGEYIGIIYNETKKRPIYFIKEYSNLGDN